MKLKDQIIGPRTKDEVERSQHWYGNTASHRPEKESCLKKETDQPKYSTVFERMSC